MPAAEHFRREHFPAPAIDPDAWRLVVGGLVETPAIIALPDLVALPARTLPVVLECAGHRRAELTPAVPGLQWQEGAVSEARWTGARLRDMLERAGVDRRATEVVLTGTDRGPFEGDGGRHPYGRSLPLRKAIDPDTLLAYEMDGEPIPAAYGGPVRAIVPGWYATDSVKWLERIQVTAEEFTGPFQAIDYRFATADDPGRGTRMERRWRDHPRRGAGGRRRVAARDDRRPGRSVRPHPLRARIPGRAGEPHDRRPRPRRERRHAAGGARLEQARLSQQRRPSGHGG